jgi:hypothetical protein
MWLCIASGRHSWARLQLGLGWGMQGRQCWWLQGKNVDSKQRRAAQQDVMDNCCVQLVAG